MSKHMFVYIMTNRNNTTLYTGVTNDLRRRAYEHRCKLIPGFTRRYRLTKLVYYEVFDDAGSAIRREKQIKGGSRAKKERLIETANPDWGDLYTSIL